MIESSGPDNQFEMLLFYCKMLLFGRIVVGNCVGSQLPKFVRTISRRIPISLLEKYEDFAMKRLQGFNCS